MFRYLLFCGDWYYPNGGWRDYKGSYSALEGAVLSAEQRAESYSWWQVVDSHTREIVAESETGSTDGKNW